MFNKIVDLPLPARPIIPKQKLIHLGKVSCIVSSTSSFGDGTTLTGVEMPGGSITTCVYDGDYELTISGFSSNCIDDGGEFDDDNNCIFNFTEEFDYIWSNVSNSEILSSNSFKALFKGLRFVCFGMSKAAISSLILAIFSLISI